MKIDIATHEDAGYILKHDRHIIEKVLEAKIDMGQVYIISEGDMPVGWMRWGLFWDNTPFLNMLFIIEGYRNRGYGSKAVRFWEEEMEKQGHDTVLTSSLSNETAQHFYRKLGYYDIGSISFDSGPLEIIFRKKI